MKSNKNKLILLVSAIIIVLLVAGIAAYIKRQAPGKTQNKTTGSENVNSNKDGLRRIASGPKKSFPLVSKLKGVESGVDEYIQTKASTASFINAPASTASKNENSSLAGRIIVIDPGHGTADNLGSTGPSGLSENLVVLEVSKILKKLLEADSAVVHLTRDSSNTELTNIQRGEFANTNKANLFLRIHADKAVDEKLTAGFQIKYYKEESQAVAEIFEKVLKDTNRPSLGIYRRFEEALDKAEMPSITIDLAKISNKDEEAMLKDKSFLNSMANSLYRAAKEFFINYAD